MLFTLSSIHFLFHPLTTFRLYQFSQYCLQTALSQKHFRLRTAQHHSACTCRLQKTNWKLKLETIVILGTGYETLGISKAGTIQPQLDVEPTVTLHNLLFLVRELISNKLVQAFDWLSCRKKRVFVGFCAGSRPKKRTKT